MGNTLGYHRKICASIFGEDSAATKFLDEKIAKQGEDAEVIVSEDQLVFALSQIHLNGDAKKAGDLGTMTAINEG